MAFTSAVYSLKCISLKNQECKVRKEIMKNDCITYPYSIRVNRCNGNCNNINNPYSRVCLPNIVKNDTLKVFDLISQQNKTKQIIFHKSCKCSCRLNPIVCNNKQKWNKNKCRCECLVDKNCKSNKFWNPNSCKFEFRKKQH